MKSMSDTVGNLLDELLGQTPRRSVAGPRPGRWTPTVVTIHDPRAELEDITSTLDGDAVPGTRPSYIMQRLRQQRHVTETPGGVHEYRGRQCCFDTIIGVDRRLHLLHIPHTFRCETCGTIFQVVHEMR